MAEVKERPIIFSGAMVRAILDGRNPWVWAVSFERYNPWLR